MKIMCVMGTRPEIIKLASFIKEIKKTDNEVILINSGQHLDMSDKMLKLFNIKPDYDLNIMTNKQDLSKTLSKVLIKLDPIVKREKPKMIVVLGDTTTALGASLVAYYNQKEILHIEGGVRSYNKYDCFPEEGNRTMIDHIADYNTCQTELDVKRLAKENVMNGIFVGNNSLDVLKKILPKKLKVKKQVLITMHRREGIGKPFQEACLGIKNLATTFNEYTFIIPMHPNPKVKTAFENRLGNIKNIELVENMPYDEFIKTLAESKLIMTDSGGIIQEAMYLRKPIIYLRDECEYEYLFNGFNLVSTGKKSLDILQKGYEILNGMKPYDKIDDFGDGTSAKQIIKKLNLK